MIIDVLTLFPEMFDGFKYTSIIGKAIKNNQVIVNFHNIRDYTNDRVDEYAYGGGGMVLMVEPIYNAIKQIKKQNTYTILLSPQGKVYKQKQAYECAKKEHIILICGHYEGFDERILKYVDIELSIGDYILTGGEIPSMVLMDSIIRLIPNVIKEKSHLNESFNNNLLDYPVYTKPIEFDKHKVPEVLLSGHHKNIEKYRLEQQILKTKTNRPDILGE